MARAAIQHARFSRVPLALSLVQKRTSFSLLLGVPSYFRCFLPPIPLRFSAGVFFLVPHPAAIHGISCRQCGQ